MNIFKLEELLQDIILEECNDIKLQLENKDKEYEDYIILYNDENRSSFLKSDFLLPEPLENEEKQNGKKYKNRS